MGLPAQFTAWRPGQPEAILHAIDTDKRFAGMVLPTGFGKSLVYMAIAFLTQRRTVVLTSTLALQRQLAREFAVINAALVQGQRRYLCKALEVGGELYGQFHESGRHRETMVDHGPCHLGVQCSLKEAGCDYFDALSAARDADIVVTNYAWWMSLYTNPAYALRPDQLVLDEAHAGPDALADAIGAHVSAKLLAAVLQEPLPRAHALDEAGWVAWARQRVTVLNRRLEGTQPRTRDAVVAVRNAQALLREMQRVAAIKPELLLISETTEGLKFDVVWAATFAEPWLFRRVPHVIMTSATMTRKTADLMGVLDRDLTMYEAGDGFPVARRPVHIVPARRPPWGDALRVDHTIDRVAQAALLEHIDTIIDQRLDRKGIIHCTSYLRRDWLLSHSRHRDRMVTHGRHDTAQQIAKFKRAAPGAILVSPAVTTGYDFPYAECEYQILVKIPFPDSRDPVTKARSIVDKRYPAHLAMQELIQSCGRGMRAADDQCETFITDGHAIWFLSKNADLAPNWFKRAVRRHDAGSIPTPPPPLGSRRSR